MPLTLYYHPFASFCQKVLIALYENGTPFEPRRIDLGDPASRAELAAVWPLAKFPVLRDAERNVVIPESSLIIDYLGRHYPGPHALIPADPEEAMRVHLWDRLFDNYVAPHVTKIVTDHFRPEGRHDPEGVEQAKALIAQTYALIERDLPPGGWACGDTFTLADCAAAPALFYANIAVPFAQHPKITAYYERLCARPSFARVIDEARPYRRNFPLAWPASYA
ncbi:glutathione S-transferase family protein [Polyangium sp. y55x31]|uniref:glutathione S-transferase family protein n=1 Tax=Polyangium sp. y55x31 TaxID=3042688 RepID=UPI0024823D91|nr:glutathione S-transferase family protein [Polyangium sp. y55x31]MDI1480325.1 glutathione S-transferase family protein [Polyangium sp. y55x31]